MEMLVMQLRPMLMLVRRMWRDTQMTLRLVMVISPRSPLLPFVSSTASWLQWKVWCCHQLCAWPYGWQQAAAGAHQVLQHILALPGD
jgi:hypothetical protein